MGVAGNEEAAKKGQPQKEAKAGDARYAGRA
jgi:hypothetical protein